MIPLGRVRPPPRDAAADQSCRIDLEHQRRSAQLLRRLGEEDVRLPEQESDRANRVRVLVGSKNPRSVAGSIVVVRARTGPKDFRQAEVSQPNPAILLGDG
jgi:hypothetical protein